MILKCISYLSFYILFLLVGYLTTVPRFRKVYAVPDVVGKIQTTTGAALPLNLGNLPIIEWCSMCGPHDATCSMCRYLPPSGNEYGTSGEWNLTTEEFIFHAETGNYGASLGGGWGCNQNPHRIRAIPNMTYPGTFFPVYFSFFSNAPTTLEIDPIIYSPMSNAPTPTPLQNGFVRGEVVSPEEFLGNTMEGHFIGLDDFPGCGYYSPDLTINGVAWECNKVGPNFTTSRTPIGTIRTLTLNPPAILGYHCTGWSVEYDNNPANVQSGSGCTATVQIHADPIPDYSGSFVRFYVSKSGPTITPGNSFHTPTPFHSPTPSPTVTPTPTTIPWTNIQGGDVYRKTISETIPTNRFYLESLPGIPNSVGVLQWSVNNSLPPSQYSPVGWNYQPSEPFRYRSFGYYQESLAGRATEIMNPVVGRSQDVKPGTQIYYYRGSAIYTLDSTFRQSIARDSTSEIYVFLIDGSLNIEDDFTIGDEDAVVFIVSGNITVEGNVRNLHGLFITDETFTIRNESGSQPIMVNGMVYSDSLSFFRTFSSPFIPTYQFIYEPKYEVLLLPYLGETKILWQELSP